MVRVQAELKHEHEVRLECCKTRTYGSQNDLEAGQEV